ncbi:class I SAM-dependent methyltransferase [Candidatus Peregrinibacteria bacterium]|nr:class I SAM-dependent methyltransferase [Candidatus Peregrinibacteria bacterium]
MFLSPRVRWLLSTFEGKKALDIGFIGEAEAELTVHKLLRKHHPHSEIIGLDTNEKKVKNCGFSNCVVGSLYDIPFKDNDFDAVVLGEVIEHLTDILPAFREISRVLKHGGRLYLTTPSCYGFFRLFRHFFLSKKFYSYKNVRNFLGNDDHKMYWEPLSIINFLHMVDLEVIQMTTANLAIPYLPQRFREWNLPFWPFNRIGSYYCLVAQKIS